MLTKPQRAVLARLAASRDNDLVRDSGYLFDKATRFYWYGAPTERVAGSTFRALLRAGYIGCSSGGRISYFGITDAGRRTLAGAGT